MGILLTGRYNQKNFDRTTSYRIDYDRLREVIETEAAGSKEKADQSAKKSGEYSENMQEQEYPWIGGDFRK